MADSHDFEALEWPGNSASMFPSRLPSVAVPSTGEVSELAEHLSADPIPHLAQIVEDGDALAFESLESFNLLCVGESGLGKSTFLRNIFAHLDPTKLHEIRRRVAEQTDVVHSLEDSIQRNEQEGRQCDDVRALQLREERVVLKAQRDEARKVLDDLKQEKRRQEHAVAALRCDINALDARLKALRAQRDDEGDDERATLLGREVIELQSELNGKRLLLATELRRSNLDKESVEEGGSRQTTDVVERLIKEMPLYDGARQGLDVTLIDTPGYGDLLVDVPGRSSADKVVAEVERRIGAHLTKDVATRDGMPLDDEKKYWNELVHLCLFFISPHRMKRADVELMRRLHQLVPLVVVIAKSDTMTTDETMAFKHEVRTQLHGEIETFKFSRSSIKEVEQMHAEQAVEHFQPLYGGSDGSLPWAVMGADESRREYIWGTAITSEPRHSELPALRDLLLRAGGWQQLKREAALKADKEAARRTATPQPKWGGFGRWQAMFVGAESTSRGPFSGNLCHIFASLLALAFAVIIALAMRDTYRKEQSSVVALERQLGALGADLSTCSQSRSALESALPAAKAESMACERNAVTLEDDLYQCTQVRKALEDDLQAQALKKTPARARSSWWG